MTHRKPKVELHLRQRGRATRKPKLNQRYIRNEAIRDMISLLERSQQRLLDHQASQAIDDRWESAKEMVTGHIDKNRPGHKSTQHTEQSAYALLHSWR